MGYKCAFDGEHYNGKPARVVTHVRQVRNEYLAGDRRHPDEPERDRDGSFTGRVEKTSEGTEIVQEALINPQHLAEFAEGPKMVSEVVVRRHPPIVRKTEEEKFRTVEE